MKNGIEVYNLHSARPIKVCLEEWPVIAVGKAGKLQMDRSIGVAIVVRRHADGRFLTEASYCEDAEEVASVARLGGKGYDWPHHWDDDDRCITFQINHARDLLCNEPGYWMSTDLIYQAAQNAFKSLEAVEI